MFFLLSVSVASFGQTVHQVRPQVPQVSDSSQGRKPLHERIPQPDPAKYRHVQDGKDWKNPFLVVRRDGIEIIGVTSIEAGIPVETVAAKLEELPDSAWPYGLVVAVMDNGIQSAGDTPVLKQNRDQLLALLKRLGIAADLWPSA